jgi:hypothetical protein
MTEEKRIILNKIDELISKRRTELLKELPSIHEIEDGIIIRFFTEWDNCEDGDGIRYKKVPNLDNPDESVVFFYIPKGAFFDLKQRFYIGCITCLSGRIDITVENRTRLLDGYSKICVESAEVQGLALENTYLITTSNRLSWSEKTRKHQESAIA